MAKEPVRMRDVAERAGVAVSTVSRVMTTPNRISAETRKVVLDAARDLGYHHPPPAKTRPGGQGAIAVLIPDITNPYYFDVIRGTQERLRDSGYAAMLFDTEQSAIAELTSLEMLAGNGTPAILAATRLTDEQLGEVAGTLPMVTINRSVPGVPSVSSDTAAVFAQAVDHLVSLGHTRLCYVAGPAGSQSNRQRWEASAAEAARLGVELTSTINFIPRHDAGAAAADAALATGATAALVFNDLLAIGVLARLAARGVRVPDDFSVVGCDDSYGASFCSPPLTTVASPSRRIGREATSMLLARLGGGRPLLGDAVVLPSHLQIRASTGQAPA
ncbi:LacI family transcriptional regulator [Propioniciclava coleopterorum]|uniref:LacI family transcriptional regulator n=1 Tax=Propioniciclava coleopterorum TaxID=2714937 RepID=A0A6G7Y639_9ACTN|nr:LacI family DNA-binding transcriptional regulator [Propioniciclava coleopterorum]QIK72275.1 LacI family transcriptional regulator [Propioniciclava coleopterorum]